MRLVINGFEVLSAWPFQASECVRVCGKKNKKMSYTFFKQTDKQTTGAKMKRATTRTKKRQVIKVDGKKTQEGKTQDGGKMQEKSPTMFDVMPSI